MRHHDLERGPTFQFPLHWPLKVRGKEINFGHWPGHHLLQEGYDMKFQKDQIAMNLTTSEANSPFNHRSGDSDAKQPKTTSNPPVSEPPHH